MSKASLGTTTSFEDKVFENADFRNSEFPQNVSFKNARFLGKTDFSGAKFSGTVDFTGTQFSGDVDFSSAAFSEPLRLEGVRFAGKTRFSGVQFHHDAHYSGTEFASNADFSNAVFHAWTRFDTARFRADATFSGACFLGSARFGQVDFTANADFSRARMVAYADFSGAAFHGKTSFANAAIDCKTLFNNGLFAKDADFSDCRFTHPVNFSGVRFEAPVSLERVVFLKFVDFKEAKIADSFTLSPPRGSEGLAPEIRFESVTLQTPEKIRFSNIGFEKITLMGTNVRGAKFDNPKWPTKGFLKSTRRAVVFDEIQKDQPDPQKLAQLYKDLRTNLKNAGATADLGDLFYSEMEVRRKQKRSGNDAGYFLRRYLSPYALLWLTCGYGRRPFRLVFTGAALFLVYWVAL